MTLKRFAVLPLLILAAVAAGCGSNNSAPPATTTTTTATTAPPTTTTTTSPTTTRAVCDLTGFALTEQRRDTVPQHIAGLTQVRTGSQDCFERIVFDFKDENLPDYVIGSASPPFSGPSGIPIPVAGSQYLRIRFGTTYARYPGFGNYDGPDSIKPGFAAIKEIRLIEDFEAVNVWVVGLDAQRPFRVGTLTGPTRLYIDIART